jgi:hypothetical protein
MRCFLLAWGPIGDRRKQPGPRRGPCPLGKARSAPADPFPAPRVGAGVGGHYAPQSVRILGCLAGAKVPTLAR